MDATLSRGNGARNVAEIDVRVAGLQDRLRKLNVRAKKLLDTASHAMSGSPDPSLSPTKPQRSLIHPDKIATFSGATYKKPNLGSLSQISGSELEQRLAGKSSSKNTMRGPVSYRPLNVHKHLHSPPTSPTCAVSPGKFEILNLALSSPQRMDKATISNRAASLPPVSHTQDNSSDLAHSATSAGPLKNSPKTRSKSSDCNISANDSKSTFIMGHPSSPTTFRRSSVSYGSHLGNSTNGVGPHAYLRSPVSPMFSENVMYPIKEAEEYKIEELSLEQEAVQSSRKSISTQSSLSLKNTIAQSRHQPSPPLATVKPRPQSVVGLQSIKGEVFPIESWPKVKEIIGVLNKRASGDESQLFRRWYPALKPHYDDPTPLSQPLRKAVSPPLRKSLSPPANRVPMMSRSNSAPLAATELSLNRSPSNIRFSKQELSESAGSSDADVYAERGRTITRKEAGRRESLIKEPSEEFVVATTEGPANTVMINALSANLTGFDACGDNAVNEANLQVEAVKQSELIAEVNASNTFNVGVNTSKGADVENLNQETYQLENIMNEKTIFTNLDTETQIDDYDTSMNEETIIVPNACEEIITECYSYEYKDAKLGNYECGSKIENLLAIDDNTPGLEPIPSPGSEDLSEFPEKIDDTLAEISFDYSTSVLSMQLPSNPENIECDEGFVAAETHVLRSASPQELPISNCAKLIVNAALKKENSIEDGGITAIEINAGSECPVERVEEAESETSIPTPLPKTGISDCYKFITNTDSAVQTATVPETVDSCEENGECSLLTFATLASDIEPCNTLSVEIEDVNESITDASFESVIENNELNGSDFNNQKIEVETKAINLDIVASACIESSESRNTKTIMSECNNVILDVENRVAKIEIPPTMLGGFDSRVLYTIIEERDEGDEKELSKEICYASLHGSAEDAPVTKRVLSQSTDARDIIKDINVSNFTCEQADYSVQTAETPAISRVPSNMSVSSLLSDSTFEERRISKVTPRDSGVFFEDLKDFQKFIELESCTELIESPVNEKFKTADVICQEELLNVEETLNLNAEQISQTSVEQAIEMHIKELVNDSSYDTDNDDDDDIVLAPAEVLIEEEEIMVIEETSGDMIIRELFSATYSDQEDYIVSDDADDGSDIDVAELRSHSFDSFSSFVGDSNDKHASLPKESNEKVVFEHQVPHFIELLSSLLSSVMRKHAVFISATAVSWQQVANDPFSALATVAVEKSALIAKLSAFALLLVQLAFFMIEVTEVAVRLFAGEMRRFADGVENTVATVVPLIVGCFLFSTFVGIGYRYAFRFSEKNLK